MEEVAVIPDLPPEVLERCLMYMCSRELFRNVALTCRAFAEIVRSETFCKNKFYADFGDSFTEEERHELWNQADESWYVT